MKNFGTIFFFLFVVIAGILIMGCTQTGRSSPTTQTAVSPALVRSDNLSAEQKYSFDEANSSLGSLIFSEEIALPEGTTPDRHIQYIAGTGIDEAASANSWSFVISHNNFTSLVVYDHRGTTIQDWLPVNGSEEIVFDTIIQPAALFKQDQSIIFNGTTSGTEVTELSLSKGMYTLTVPVSGKTRILIFDAETGALIRSND